MTPTSAATSSATTASTSPGATATTEFDDPQATGAPTVAGTVVGAAPQPGQSACRTGNPLADVYHPNRLGVLDACLTVSGTVMSITPEPDGDIHFDLALDPQYTGLLTAANRTYQHSWLVAEIVPADQPGCKPGQPPKAAYANYDFGICTGANEATPAKGSHVVVTGPHVLDHDHSNWAEIHPVWAVSAQASPPLGTTIPTATAPLSTTPAPPPSGGTTITSTPSGVTPGQNVSLAAETSPNGACSLAVSLPSGAQSTSAGVGPATADASGKVSWTWKIGTRTSPGTATATVTCPTGTVTAPFQIV